MAAIKTEAGKSSPSAIDSHHVKKADDLRDQLNTFGNLPVKKYPGIEVNYREGIACTDPAYIRESLQVMRECGMDGAVLAWDIMNAPDSHLKAVISRE